MIEQLDFLINGVPHYINIIAVLFILIGALILIIAALYAYRAKRVGLGLLLNFIIDSLYFHSNLFTFIVIFRPEVLNKDRNIKR